MRSPLSKRIPRDLLKNFIKYMGMVIILACTICVGTAFKSTIKGTREYLDGINEENYLEDGYFEVDQKIDSELINLLEKENKLTVYENFYVTENEFADSTKMILYNERKNIDTPVIFEGKLPKKDNEVAIAHIFARVKHLSVGDTVKIFNNEYTISGTISLPDYTALFMNNTDIVMNTKHFCVGVLSKDGFEKIDDSKRSYKYSYRYANRNMSDKEINDNTTKLQLMLASNGATVQSILNAKENQSLSFLTVDMGKDEPFITVFVYILIALIAFVFAIMTSNTIEKESVIIGTLRASGYKKGEIIWHYLQPTLIIAIVGSAIGNAFGYTVAIKPFLNLYYTSYCVGPIEIKFNPAAFLLTTVLPVVIMILINYIMLARKLSLNPLRFLRKDLKKKKKQKAKKLPNISFINRFRLRVILQNKGSYVMLFIGVFLASFLLMFGIGLKPLINHYTDTIDDSLPYNYQYILKAPVDADNGEKILLYEMETWFKLGKKDIAISCFGVKDNSSYFNSSLSDEVTISSALSKKMNLDVGDTIHLKDKNTDKKYDMEITKIYEYASSLAIFMPIDELCELLELDAGTYNCILSDEKLDIDEQYVAKQISRNDVVGAANQLIDSFGAALGLVNVFSVIVYLVLIYILTKVVIDKNAISISYMKVFGYEPKEIRKVYLTTTTLVVIASLIVCIPVEVAVFKGVLIYLSSLLDGYLEFYLPVRVYIEIVIIGLVSYFAINATHVWGIKKIPMTDALKNRE